VPFLAVNVCRVTVILPPKAKPAQTFIMTQGKSSKHAIGENPSIHTTLAPTPGARSAVLVENCAGTAKKGTSMAYTVRESPAGFLAR
jgi:hypothetical protein